MKWEPLGKDGCGIRGVSVEFLKGLSQTISLVFLSFCPEKILQILLLKISFSLFLQVLVPATLRIFHVVQFLGCTVTQ